MRHQWNKRLIGAVCAALVGLGTGVSDASPAWSVGAENLIAIKDAKSLDIELVYENIRHASPSVIDLASMEEELDGQTVREMIAEYQLPTGDIFSRGKLVTEEEKQRLLDNRNLPPIGKMQPIGYGVAVRRANVKSLPMGGGLFAAPDDTERDILQQGALDPCEPVRLLHVSADRRYYLVQSETMCGWAFIGDIAVAKKGTWERYTEPAQFVTVISRGERIKQANETVYAQMGARLPLRSEDEKQYKVVMPIRGDHGKLVEAETLIDKSEAFHLGYLEYTADNLNQLANAYVGAPYGYRGLKNSEDNSGLITDIYRAMGITLPRKTDELQEAAALLPPCGDAAVITAPNGDNLLVIARDGANITVVGQTDDGKQIGMYTTTDMSRGGAK